METKAMETKRTTLLREYQARAQSLREEITRLERVSTDEAHRRWFHLSGILRAIEALTKGRIFLSGEGAKGVLILGLNRLPDEAVERFCAALSLPKAKSNSALRALDGVRAHVRKNRADTCWVIEIDPTGPPLFAWPAGRLPDGRPWETTDGTTVRLAGPRLPVTNGGAHWVGVINATTPIDPVRSPMAAAFVAEAMAAMARDGLTPLQREAARRKAEEEAEARRRAISEAAQEAGRRDGRRVVPEGFRTVGEGTEYIEAAERLAGDGPVPANLADLVQAEIAARRAAEAEARRKAEEEAEARRRAEEEARLAAEKAAREAAEAEARRKAEQEEIARRHAGLSPEQWAALPEKRRRIAIHNARLAGLIR
jgi:hypothetical protein